MKFKRQNVLWSDIKQQNNIFINTLDSEKATTEIQQIQNYYSPDYFSARKVNFMKVVKALELFKTSSYLHLHVYNAFKRQFKINI